MPYIGRKGDGISKYWSTSLPVLILCIYFGLQNYHFPCWKVFTYGDIIKILAIFTLLTILKIGRFPINKQILYLVIIYVLGITLALWYGDQSDQMWSILSGYYMSIVVFFLIVFYFRERKYIEKLLFFYLVASFIVCAIVVFDTHNKILNYLNQHGIVQEIVYKYILVSPKSFPDLNRRTFFNINANVFADLLVMSLLILAFFWVINSFYPSERIRKWKKYFFLSYLLLGGTAFLSVGSRGSYVALMLSMSAFFLAMRRISINRIVKVGCVWVSLIFIILILSNYTTSARIAVLRVETSVDPILRLFRGDVESYKNYTTARSFSKEASSIVRIAEAEHSLDLYLKSDLMSIVFGHNGRHTDWALWGGNHVGYIYLMIEFGLLTAVAVLGLMIYLFRKLVRLRRKYLSYRIRSPNFMLVTLGISIMVSFIVKLLVAPPGTNFFPFMAIVTVIVMVCERDVSIIARKYKVKRLKDESASGNLHGMQRPSKPFMA